MSLGLSSYAETAMAKADPVQRICLIIPPSPFLLDERVFVSLGILKIAATLRRHGHSVSVLDLSGIQNYLDALEAYVDTSDDDVIGLTVTTPQLPVVMEIARALRRLGTDARLILGGPHVTLSYAALRNSRVKSRPAMLRAKAAVDKLEALFDVLVPGDGELAVHEALQQGCPKVIDGDDRKGGYFMTDEVYNQTPMPARDLVDLSSYNYSIEGFAATSLIAQLGCPFSCAFCGGRYSSALRVTRTRTTESVISELEYLHKEYGYTGFMFYDDELNVSPTMVELMNAISDLQDRLGVEFRLRGFVKSELLTEVQAKSMYAAGFRWLLCGFEAAAPRILSNIEKRATVEDNIHAIEMADKAGLKTKALMSIGHAGETEETALAIRDWLIEMGVDDFDCTIITTYPGTPYYDLSVPHEQMPGVWTYTHPKSGDRLHSIDVDFSETAEYYKGDPDGGYASYVFTDALKSEELVALRDVIERDVRKRLNLPFYASRAALRYEHSMGQGLPASIFRRTEAQAAE